MKTHLSPREFVAALDGALDEGRSRHLESCAPCRDQLGDLRETVESLGTSSDVPDPSPLFWGQFGDRVRRATADDAVPSRASSWWSWRPVVVLAPAAVAVMLVVATLKEPVPYVPEVEEGLAEPGVPALPAPPVDVPVGASAGVSAVEGSDGPAWSQIVDLATGVSVAELQGVAPAADLGTDAIIEELTQTQRAELLRLLRAEMGGGA